MKRRRPSLERQPSPTLLSARLATGGGTHGGTPAQKNRRARREAKLSLRKETE